MRNMNETIIKQFCPPMAGWPGHPLQSFSLPRPSYLLEVDSEGRGSQGNPEYIYVKLYFIFI